jgi:hypothetical protein
VSYWQMILALFVGVAMAYWVAAQSPNLETLALGETTAAVYGSYQDDKIFCGSLTELPECLRPAAERKLKKRVLWLGNSQLHAINQPKPGDKTSPTLLAGQLRPSGVEVLAFSFPSASLAEMLVAYAHLQAEHPVDVLVIPAFLDDTREQSTRAMLAPAVNSSPVAAMLADTAVGREVKRRLASSEDKETLDRSDQSLQTKSEDAITRALEKCCGVEFARSQARGLIAIEAFLLRNWLFNVTAQTVRPIIPEAYAHNVAALAELLKRARANGTQVIVYVPPLRQDFSPPYDPAQYTAFKTQIAELATRNGARFVNVETIVPPRYWGTKQATRTGGGTELDFMHYQGEGHALLQKSLEPTIKAALK